MLEGRTVLITGSESGIGAAAAERAKAYGAEVILHGKTESKALKQSAKTLNASYIHCDVSNAGAVQRAMKGLLKKTKRIDALIHCAGIVEHIPFLKSTDQDWWKIFHVNLLGTVHFCQVVAPLMQKAGYGRIVTVASIRGHSTTAAPQSIIYSASKAAVVNLTATLAKAYAPHVLVNGVSPGFTRTGMSKTWTRDTRRHVNSALVGHAAEPIEIAEVLLFLASERNTFMTGETLIVDGGYTLAGK